MFVPFSFEGHHLTCWMLLLLEFPNVGCEKIGRVPARASG